MLLRLASEFIDTTCRLLTVGTGRVCGAHHSLWWARGWETVESNVADCQRGEYAWGGSDGYCLCTRARPCCKWCQSTRPCSTTACWTVLPSLLITKVQGRAILAWIGPRKDFPPVGVCVFARARAWLIMRVTVRSLMRCVHICAGRRECVCGCSCERVRVDPCARASARSRSCDFFFCFILKHVRRMNVFYLYIRVCVGVWVLLMQYSVHTEDSILLGHQICEDTRLIEKPHHQQCSLVVPSHILVSLVLHHDTPPRVHQTVTHHLQ